MTGEEQRDSAEATPPEPTWHMITHYMGDPANTTLAYTRKIVPVEFFDLMAQAYAADAYLIMGGNQGAPARKIMTTRVRPCLPHEIPEEDR